MKIFISPAKSLDFESKINVNIKSNPQFQSYADDINNLLKGLSAPDISNLLNISPKLSELNWSRNQHFQDVDAFEKHAIFAFNGDVYNGIDASSISELNYQKLQNSLRILSGLYGILKPFDMIRPYRLEMGTKISINGSKNLYEFWKQSITESILKETEKDEFIINLASNEYFSVVDTSQIKNNIISPQFKDLKNGELKIISFYAKKARGLMTRFLIDNDIQSLSDIHEFNYSGYSFSQAETKNELEPVFIR